MIKYGLIIWNLILDIALFYPITLIVSIPFLIRDVIIYLRYKAHKQEINNLIKKVIANYKVQFTCSVRNGLFLFRVDKIESNDSFLNFPLEIKNSKYDFNDTSRILLMKNSNQADLFATKFIEHNIKEAIITDLCVKLKEISEKTRFINETSFPMAEFKDNAIIEKYFITVMKQCLIDHFKFLKYEYFWGGLWAFGVFGVILSFNGTRYPFAFAYFMFLGFYFMGRVSYRQ